MRDLSNQEKHENQKLTKQTEKLTSEMNIVKKERDRVHAEVKNLQEEMIELKEQVHVMHLGLGMGWNCMWIGDRIILKRKTLWRKRQSAGGGEKSAGGND